MRKIVGVTATTPLNPKNAGAEWELILPKTSISIPEMVTIVEIPMPEVLYREYFFEVTFSQNTEITEDQRIDVFINGIRIAYYQFNRKFSGPANWVQVYYDLEIDRAEFSQGYNSSNTSQGTGGTSTANHKAGHGSEHSIKVIMYGGGYSGTVSAFAYGRKKIE